MNRDYLWVGIAIAATFGGAYWNEKYNLANHQLERDLIGCWGGSTGSNSAYTGTVMFDVRADGSFRESAIESIANDPKYTRLVSAAGTWKVQKDRWILSYNEATPSLLFPRAGRSLRLIVVQVNEQSINAKGDYAVSLPFNLSRLSPKAGACQASV